MSITSFKNIDAQAASDVTVETTAVPTPEKQDLFDSLSTPPAALQTTNTALATEDDFDCGNDGFGELDANQIKTPFLKLAHAVGDLGKAGFVPGSIVFDGNAVLIEPKRQETAIPPAEGVTIYLLKGLGVGLDYMENISNDQHKLGIRPRIFKTETEARAAGLLGSKKQADEYKLRNPGSNPGRYGPRVSVKVLIEGKADSGFPLEFGGKFYTVGGLVLTKGSYWAAGKTLYTAVNTARQLKLPLAWTGWKLYTKYDVVPGASDGSWTIQAKQHTRATPEFLEWVKQYI